MKRDARLRGAAVQLYRIALLTYPRGFRERFGPEMVRAAVDRARDEGTAVGRARYWLLALRDASAGGLAERWAARPAPRASLRPARSGMMTNLTHDMRQALRGLARTPVFTLTVIATFAVALGVNISIFSVLYGVSLKPLPYPAPERLVRLWDANQAQGLAGFSVSVVHLDNWRRNNTVFERIGVYREARFSLFASGDAEQVGGARVDSDLLHVLGVAPALGRTFSPEEDRPGATRVVILSDGLWRRSFGGDSTVIGRRITVDGEPHVVVGVMPPGFSIPQQRDIDILIPYGLVFDRGGPDGHFLRVLARLRDGVAVTDARASIDAMAARLEQTDPQFHRGWTIVMLPLHEATVAGVQTTLTILMSAVGFVLVIACANVVGLLLSRSVRRRRELAIRAALGAGRRHLARLVIVECLALAMAGGAAGLGVAVAVRRGLSAAVEALPRPPSETLDLATLVFAFGAALAAGMVCAVTPALRAAAASFVSSLREGGASSVAPRARSHRLLVAIDSGLAVALLVGAGLLGRSYLKLTSEPVGFDASGVTVFEMTAAETRYTTREARAALFAGLVDRVRAIPGVESVAVVHRLPLEGNSIVPLWAADRPAPPRDATQVFNYRSVSADYFATLGMPLRAGRMMTDREAWVEGGVVVINESLAGALWPDRQNPVGQRIVRPDGRLEVIGVVADAKEAAVDQPAQPAVYLPYVVAPGPAMQVLVRSTLPPEALVGPVRAATRAVDPQQASARFRTLGTAVGATLAESRIQAQLVAIFAGAALLLAAAGVYGVISFAVEQRRREIGVRIALGASVGCVVRLILAQGLAPAAAGAAAGLAGAVGVGKFLSSQLFGVSPVDPVVFLAAGPALIFTAALACIGPARRAIRTDPAKTLHAE
jgi:putative ABC transport system permease protein